MALSRAQPAAEATDRVRLVILYGGQSAEHEVSCISALNVLEAASRTGRYDLRLIGVTTAGRWVDATAAIDTIAAVDATDTLGGGAPRRSLPSPDTLDSHHRELGGGHRPGTDLLRATDEGHPGAVVVFPMLHGPMGEDGTVQGLLEVAGVPYVGAGVVGSASAMDKGMAKQAFAAAGLPQARYLGRRHGEIDDLLAKTVEAELGWPVFVKPANLGSSVGISRADDPAGLAVSIDLALRFDEYVIVEEAVNGREIEVAALGWPDLRISVPGEIVASRDFYDFEDKYLTGTAELRVPADLPAEVEAQIPVLATAACRALRVDGMARVDFFYEAPGRGLLVNEVNTIPGFTPTSMYPLLWAASGIDYPTLVDTLVELARRRHERRSGFERHRPSEA